MATSQIFKSYLTLGTYGNIGYLEADQRYSRSGNKVTWYIDCIYDRYSGYATDNYTYSYSISATINGTTKTGTITRPGSGGTNTVTLGPFTYSKGATAQTSISGKVVFSGTHNFNAIVPKGGTYTVTFDKNGGNTPSKSSITVVYGYAYNKVEALATCSRTGYTFAGWNTKADGTGSTITDSTNCSLTANQTLYAKWTANTYTVSFDKQGGSGTTNSKTVTYDSTYGTMPADPTKTGYTFKGWYTASSGGTKITSSSKVSTASNHTLYAQWTANSYDVSYDANGSEEFPATVSPTSQPKTYGSAYGEMPVPVRDGFEFAGWYTAATGGTKITEATVVSTATAHTLYAHWASEIHTLTFDPNGGTVSETTRQVATGEAYGDLPVPVRTGYGFLGWFTLDNEQIEADDIVGSSDLIVYAHWEPLSILHLVKNNQAITVTQICVVKNEHVYNVLGCYVVKNGQVYQGV